MQFGQISPSSRGPRGASLVLPGLATLGTTAARRPRVTPHHSDVVHTAYLHIPGAPLRMRTLVAGCYSGPVCMASGGAMAYCALARTWLCPAPRMGGLDHGAQGACSAQAKKDSTKQRLEIRDM